MRISSVALEGIRSRADLVAFIADTVTLKKSGSDRWLGLCPFHAERTPSFNVVPAKGFFHCFGCAAHGDIFTFAQHVHGGSFRDAVETVCARFGLELPALGESVPLAPLRAAVEAAQAYFRAALASGMGEFARAYLAERGVTHESIERFGIGYAPPDGLVATLRQQRIDVGPLLDVGLVKEHEGSGRRYDAFRHRIMFPIADASGRVIAFSGRWVPTGLQQAGSPPPKYINSPESPMFSKRATLYGLSLARESMRAHGRAIIVEGQLDVVLTSQAGVAEVVAPLGTALTIEQVRRLRSITDNLVTVFDGDGAGQKAAAKAFCTCVQAGAWGATVTLPAGEDPASLAQRDPAAYRALLASTTPLLDVYVASLATEGIAATAQQARDVAGILRQVDDPLARDILARKAARRLGVRTEALQLEAARKAPVVDEDPLAARQWQPCSADASFVAALVLLKDVPADIVELVPLLAPEWQPIAQLLLATPFPERHAVLAQAPAGAHRALGDMLHEDATRLMAAIDGLQRRLARAKIARLRAQLREPMADRSAVIGELNSLLVAASAPPSCVAPITSTARRAPAVPGTTSPAMGHSVAVEGVGGRSGGGHGRESQQGALFPV